MTIITKVIQMITAFLDVILGLAINGNNVTKALSAVIKTMVQLEVIPDVCTIHPVTMQLKEDAVLVSIPNTALTVLFKDAEHSNVVSHTAKIMKYTQVDFLRSLRVENIIKLRMFPKTPITIKVIGTSFQIQEAM
jgi:hypothetical protein